MSIDLRAVAQAFLAAADRADALPYRVEFDVDEKLAAIIMRGSHTEGMWQDAGTTGRPLFAVMQNPEHEFEHMFGFLDASVGEKLRQK